MGLGSTVTVDSVRLSALAVLAETGVGSTADGTWDRAEAGRRDRGGRGAGKEAGERSASGRARRARSSRPKPVNCTAVTAADVVASPYPRRHRPGPGPCGRRAPSSSRAPGTGAAWTSRCYTTTVGPLRPRAPPPLGRAGPSLGTPVAAPPILAAPGGVRHVRAAPHGPWAMDPRLPPARDLAGATDGRSREDATPSSVQGSVTPRPCRRPATERSRRPPFHPDRCPRPGPRRRPDGRRASGRTRRSKPTTCRGRTPHLLDTDVSLVSKPADKSFRPDAKLDFP